MTAGRVVLVGAVHESLAALEAVASHPRADLVRVVTLTPALASRTSGAVDIGAAASALGVDVLYVEDANHPDAVAEIRSSAPDLIVVVGWTRLIRDELLAIPPRGCVGFHASLLPRHRGRAPVNWAILRGETETGNTMMLLDRGVDTGRIIDQRATPIAPDDTCGSVYERVALLGAEMLTDNLDALLDGTIEPREQDDAVADLLPKRTPEMGVTDWTRTPGEIHDWIRALTRPYPGAFTHLDGRPVMLWASRPPDREPAAHGAPGTILARETAGLRVAARAGSILVTRMGDASGPAEDAGAWATRHGVEPGARFENPPPDVVAWTLGRGPRPSGASA